MQTRKNDPVSPVEDFVGQSIGLTKREFFAAAALQGLLANPQSSGGYHPGNAVRLADQLIIELNKQND